MLWDVETDPTLAGTKLIAEAWDAAGLYQVGSFIGDAWLEWNGRFRDDVRRFVKGDRGAVRGLAARLLGSPDIYGHEHREAEQSVNFVTSHDGFTLNDLVSYNQKHNEANAENNCDGANDNLSWNCGIEGPRPRAPAKSMCFPTDRRGDVALQNLSAIPIDGAKYLVIQYIWQQIADDLRNGLGMQVVCWHFQGGVIGCIQTGRLNQVSIQTAPTTSSLSLRTGVQVPA